MEESEVPNESVAPAEPTGPTTGPAPTAATPTAPSWPASGGADPAPTAEVEPTVPTPPTPTAPVPATAPGSPTPFLPPHWREPGTPGADAPAGSGGALVPVWGGPPAATEPPAPAQKRRGPWPWVVVALVAALIGAGVGAAVVAAADHGGSTTNVKEISAGPALLNGTTDIQSVIAKVLPAVVSIDATAPQPQSDSFFGGGGAATEELQGTGVIITSDGEVVTNNHVISGATTITVTLYGQTKALPATLVDTDPTNDIALLQITGVTGLPTVTYGNSDHVQVGDGVVAIGNALGLSAGTPTVTQGIISAEGRTVQAGDEGSGATETLNNMFQTDAAINPGNSGGPLVDSSGKVIAMNTAVAASADGSSQAQNIGFAIPSNKITGELPALRAKQVDGQAAGGSGYLGVSIETLTPQLRSAYNFVPSQGAIVTQVVPGSPADVAGLQEGDVITSLDGKAVTSADQLASSIQAAKPGQSVKIGLYRGQEQLTVTATLSSAAQAQSSSGG